MPFLSFFFFPLADNSQTTAVAIKILVLKMQMLEGSNQRAKRMIKSLENVTHE